MRHIPPTVSVEQLPWVLPYKLSHLVCDVTKVTEIPKGAPSPYRVNYRQILITPILPKVYEKLVSRKLFSICEKCGLLPAVQFAYSKGLGCTDSLVTICHYLQKSLDTMMESYIVQLDLMQPSIEWVTVVSHSN